jgi:arabinose-5-phosphate isomerase
MKSTKKSILDSARETLLIESEALLQLSKIIDKRFEEAVKLLLKSKGRLVVTGIGKSANIAQKIVATLNSTGQPALFLHAADAIHGDLGNLQKHDVLLCISKSGDSPEIKVLIPLVRSMGNVVIGMTANEKSFLASKSDIVLHTPIDKEACPNNLAPTTSTTVQLAVGDALAVALMDQRGFTSADFAKYHPGGALGKKLYTRMGDLLGENSKPAVSPETPDVRSPNRSCASRMLRVRRMTAWRQKKRGGENGAAQRPHFTPYTQNAHVTLSESTRGTRVDESKGNQFISFTNQKKQ